MPDQITVQELARRLAAAAEPTFIVDVRQPWEHATAALPDQLLLPLNEIEERWEEIGAAAPAGALIVTYCHHGIRSLNAAAFLESKGVHPVRSLAGGIEAWSSDVDPKIPRY